MFVVLWCVFFFLPSGAPIIHLTEPVIFSFDTRDSYVFSNVSLVSVSGISFWCKPSIEYTCRNALKCLLKPILYYFNFEVWKQCFLAIFFFLVLLSACPISYICCSLQVHRWGLNCMCICLFWFLELILQFCFTDKVDLLLRWPSISLFLQQLCS